MLTILVPVYETLVLHQISNISGETCDIGVRRLFDGKRKVCVNHIGASI